VVANRLRELLDAYEAADVDRARNLHYATIPVIRAMGRVGGVIFAKTAMRLRGIDVGDPRLPLPPATEEQVAAIAGDLQAAGIALADSRGVDDHGQGALGPRAAADLGAEVAYH
jgi:4-hydroxy-tetrahydrodipicolinate synthase